MANDFPKTPYDTWHQERIHPNAPAGGGGPGFFTTAGPLGSSAPSWGDLPHPDSPAGRYLTAQEILLPTLTERIESVVRAYSRALSLAPRAVYQETGYQLDQIKAGLLPGLLQMLAVLGISVVGGAAAGTAIGFFLGGVGAAPGAVVGAELGLDIGIAVLTWLGLGFLAVAIGQGMGELTSVLRRGIHRAWLAPEHLYPHFETDRAAEDLAKAEGILFRLILQGLLAYVLKNGAVSSSQAALSTGQAIARGGTRAVADETLAEVSELLRNSKLPEEFVVWIERNWEDLKRNPKLASNTTGPTVSSQASSSAATPSELKAMRERQGREDIGKNPSNGKRPVGEQTQHDMMTGKDSSSVPVNSLRFTAEQADNLKGLAKAELGQLTAAKQAGQLTNAELGPALSVAQDLKTGQISQVWRNNPTGDAPANLSETLARRWADAPDEVLSFERTHGMASHAEIYAVDELLKARPDASLSDFAVFTMETRIPKYRGEFKPACTQCNWLLDGVQYVK